MAPVGSILKVSVDVEPFFFGPADRKQFGIYHPPEGMPKDEGAVICAPLFAEYLRSYACLRRLSLTLAGAGLHVLRFDYYGAGESSGNFEDTTPEDWERDVRTAVAELQAISGVRRVRLTGVRLGATLAARVAIGNPAVSRIAMWDPVVDGAAYLGQLEATHARLVAAHDDPHVNGTGGSSGRELVGFRVSDELVRRMAGLSLPGWADLTQNGARPARVVLSAGKSGYEALRRDAAAHGVPVKRVDFNCDWTTHSQAILFPHGVVSALAEEA